MELRLIFLIIGIIIAVLYYIFEIQGQKEFELFAYNIGITMKKRKLKINSKSFDRLYNNLYIKDGLFYKFISDDICLVRYEMDTSSYRRAYIVMYIYKITIENKKYVVRLKMPVAHLIIIAISLFRLFYIIFIERKYSFHNIDSVLIISIIFCLIMFIIAKYRMKDVVIKFLNILRENK